MSSAERGPFAPRPGGGARFSSPAPRRRRGICVLEGLAALRGQPEMSAHQRRGYWDIVLAYLLAAHHSWLAGEQAVEAGSVTEALGINEDDETDVLQELEHLGLVRTPDLNGSDTLYRLLPRGVALMERQPSLEHLLARQFAAIDETSQGTPEEKQQAKTGLKDELYKAAVGKGLDWVLSNLPTIIERLRAIYPWLPWMPGGPPGKCRTVGRRRTRRAHRSTARRPSRNRDG